MADRVIVVYPPDAAGGRRVRVDGTILGRARDLRALTGYLRRAGLDGIGDLDVFRSTLIEWRGGAPENWNPA